MKKIASCKKIFSKNFAYFLKKTLQILQHANIFIVFLHTCYKNQSMKKVAFCNKLSVKYVYFLQSDLVFCILKKSNMNLFVEKHLN